MYWPKPLKTLQTTALLDSLHRVIDSLFSPKSKLLRLCSVYWAQGRMHLFIATLWMLSNTTPLCWFWQESLSVQCLVQQTHHSWLRGVLALSTGAAPLAPANCGVSSRFLLCPCTPILKKNYRKGLKQPVYAMVRCWYCLQSRKPWSLSFLVEQNSSTGLFKNKRMDFNAVKIWKVPKVSWVKAQSVLLWSSAHRGIQWGRRARHAET